MLKRALLEGSGDSMVGGGKMGDVNGDGAFDKEDVKELMRLMNDGKDPENKEEEPIESPTATTTAPIVTTMMRESELLPQPVYGPPNMLEEDAAAKPQAGSKQTTTTARN